MAEFEVPIVKITKVEDHPNADRLSLIWFRGFAVVSAKLEDGSSRYAPGDLVVYCPQDSIIPEYLLRQGFWNEETGKGMLAGSNGDRVKPIKLRGILSEGIMFPVCSDDGTGLPHIEDDRGTPIYVTEGQNVAEFLGISKYEPVLPAGMSGEVTYIGTGKIPHFEIENIKKFPDILDPDELVCVTEKLHGTFFGIGYLPDLNHPDLWDGDFFCYSKGLGAKGLVFKNSETNKNNLYVKQFEKILPRIKMFVDVDAYEGGRKKLFILGEIFGKGVQDLDYGSKEPQFRVFDIYLEDNWMDWDNVELASAAHILDVPTVPVLFKSRYKDYNAELKNGSSTLASHVREGVVIKPVTPRHSDELGGRVILKDINEKYLTRKGGTEFN